MQLHERLLEISKSYVRSVRHHSHALYLLLLLEDIVGNGLSRTV